MKTVWKKEPKIKPVIYFRICNDQIMYIGETSNINGLRPWRYELEIGEYDYIITVPACSNERRRRYWEAYCIVKFKPLKNRNLKIYHTLLNKILLVQSRGNLWGFPKGTFEEGETYKTCAIRELDEETGIIIGSDLLSDSNKIFVNKKACYFYVETNIDTNLIEIQGGYGNDANGIGWVHLDCIRGMVLYGQIKLNYHARQCLYKQFGLSIN